MDVDEVVGEVLVVFDASGDVVVVGGETLVDVVEVVVGVDIVEGAASE